VTENVWEDIADDEAEAPVAKPAAQETNRSVDADMPKTSMKPVSKKTKQQPGTQKSMLSFFAKKK